MEFHIMNCKELLSI